LLGIGHLMQAEFENCLRDAELASLLMLFNEGRRVSSRRKASVEQQLADIGTTFRLIGNAI
jgi:hypothetical protein